MARFALVLTGGGVLVLSVALLILAVHRYDRAADQRSYDRGYAAATVEFYARAAESRAQADLEIKAVVDRVEQTLMQQRERAASERSELRAAIEAAKVQNAELESCLAMPAISSVGLLLEASGSDSGRDSGTGGAASGDDA